MNKEVPAKPSLYALYIQEREGFSIIEEKSGFASYKMANGECYIRDVYITPERRMGGLATRIVDQIRVIAGDAGCKVLITTVAPSGLGSTESIKAILSYGFRLHSSQNDFIIFRIDL